MVDDSGLFSDMGNCVGKDQKSALKFRWSVGSETVKVPSEINNAINWEKEIGRLCSSPLSSPMDQALSSPEFGKGEEKFFDSHPWIDSDNEDFFSVNGDNTPSCGSTPIWHAKSVETPMPEPEPKDVKKPLIELFRDSFNDDQARSAANPSHFPLQLTNMEASVNNRRSRAVKGKSAHSTPCCMPNLARSLSLGVGDRKKRLSPCHGGGQVEP